LFGILTTVKSSNKSHPTEVKVLKRYTTDLPDVLSCAFVNSLTFELSQIERRMSLRFVKAMSKISTGISLTYKYNKQKQRLFTYPFRITDVNSDTVVIDRTSKDDGRVVVLGTEGNVKWIYQGHPQINTEYKPFDPKDIVTIVCSLTANILCYKQYTF
jgi:hypothetical protein